MATVDRSRSLSIAFTGDVSFTGRFDNPRWTIESVDRSLLDFLHASDHVVVNLEGPLTSAPATMASGAVSLMSRKEHISTLRDLNCTILNLANNHILDSGRQGLDDTIETAKSAGIVCHGAGATLQEACAPLVLSRGSVSVALVGLTVDIGQGASTSKAGTCSGLKVAEFRALIDKAKALADWTVVQYHGGDEFVSLPSRQETRLLRGFVDAGADIVVCHHGHVVQPYERYRHAVIFYGLGNLIFDIPGHRGFPGTEESVVVRVVLGKRPIEFDFVRTRLDRNAFQIHATREQGAFPALDFTNYRERYCRAVYNAYYWPFVPRTALGLPNRYFASGGAHAVLAKSPDAKTLAQACESDD